MYKYLPIPVGTSIWTGAAQGREPDPFQEREFGRHLPLHCQVVSRKAGDAVSEFFAEFSPVTWFNNRPVLQENRRRNTKRFLLSAR